MIITEEQIEEEKQKIIVASRNLEDSVLDFIATLNTVQEVIDGVKIAANTYGGHQRADAVDKIANMEIDKKKIKIISDSISQINVNVDMVKVQVYE